MRPVTDEARRPPRRSAVALCCGLALLLAPQSSGAAGRDFSPRLMTFFGKAEIESLYEEESRATNGLETREAELNLRELLDLGTMGYIYHPRFITFLLQGAIGLDEEKRSEDNQGWSTTSAESYEVRATALPQHPYNLEVFRIVRAPLIAGRLVEGSETERAQHGAILRYRQRPWTGELSYRRDDAEYSTLASDTDTYRLAGGYANPVFSLSGSYQNQDYADSIGQLREQDYFTLHNSINALAMRLLSNWELTEEHETTSSGLLLKRWRMLWSENLTLDLPANFTAESTFRRSSDKNSSRSPGEEPAPDIFNDTDFVSFGLRHQLYKSLSSRYFTSYQEAKTSSGSSHRASQRLSFDYTKAIPRGRLASSLWTGVSDLVQAGAPVELATAPVAIDAFNRITLTAETIDRDSLTVEVQDSTSGLRRELDRDLHYRVRQIGTDTEIEILTLAGLPGFTGALDSYRYIVTYSLRLASYEITTRDWGYSLRLHLLDNLLSPYYSHSRNNQVLTGGSYPGTLSERLSDTVGLDLSLAPWGAGIEYSRVVSNQEPYRRWLTSLSYERDLSLYTTLDASISREEIEYLEGRSGSALDAAYTERTDSAAVALYSTFPKLNLNAMLGANASLVDGLSENRLLSLLSSLTWRVGRIDLTLRCNYSTASTEFQGTEHASRETLTVYFKLTRKLF